MFQGLGAPYLSLSEPESSKKQGPWEQEGARPGEGALGKEPPSLLLTCVLVTRGSVFVRSFHATSLSSFKSSSLVSYGTDESLSSTPEANIALYVN